MYALGCAARAVMPMDLSLLLAIDSSKAHKRHSLFSQVPRPLNAWPGPAGALSDAGASLRRVRSRSVGASSHLELISKKVAAGILLFLEQLHLIGSGRALASHSRDRTSTV